MKKFLPMFRLLWLWEQDANIYLKLLENWALTITELSVKTQLHRTQLYRMLPFLIESGYVIQSMKGKKKYYLPASPEIVQNAFENLASQNSQNIAYLQNLYNHLDSKPTVIYEKWAKGITKVFSDIVSSTQKWDVFYRVTSESDTDFINENYLPKDYREKRDKKELERYVIMSSKSAQNKTPRLQRDLKIVPEKIDEFDDNVLMTIYGQKVAFVDFNTETSIIIENKQIADFQKKLFQMLYKSL